MSGSKNPHLATFKELVAHVPQVPGCYLWKNAAGEVLYVGKAKNLRSRIRQYINGDDERVNAALMMSEAAFFDYIVVDTEHEALVLEINLIQQYHPVYNVALMDDKSYPFIALTTADRYPAIKYTREKHRADTTYFGPYTDAHTAKKAIDVVRKLCPLCIATCAEWKRCKRRFDAAPQAAAQFEEELRKRGRPCFDAHVGRGPGVCTASITPKEYAEHVKTAVGFLSGKHKELLAQLESERTQAAAALDFEQAARIQRRYDVLTSLDGEQQVYLSGDANADLLGIWREETIAAAFLFVVREGRVVRSVDYILRRGAETQEGDIISAFLRHYYAQTADIPRRIEVLSLPEDAHALETWLASRRASAQAHSQDGLHSQSILHSQNNSQLQDGSHTQDSLRLQNSSQSQNAMQPQDISRAPKVSLHVPLRGERKKLLDTASRNARHALMRYELKTGYEDERINRALLELESALALDKPPLRIECFDISTIHGKHTVGSMVVFSDGRPNKKEYRRFKIQTPLDEANDFVSMAEVFERRYSPQRMADKRFGSRPDLIVVDGGKPQLHAAKEQLDAFGLDIPIVGLAKADEEIYTAFSETPAILPAGSPSLYLIKRVRDEAHRFAITYHRQLRGKAMTASILDEIEGIGSKRKRALMKHFGSMKQLRAASEEEIAQVGGISDALAHEIYETLVVWQRELRQKGKR